MPKIIYENVLLRRITERIQRLNRKQHQVTQALTVNRLHGIMNNTGCCYIHLDEKQMYFRLHAFTSLIKYTLTKPRKKKGQCVQIPILKQYSYVYHGEETGNNIFTQNYHIMRITRNP